MKIAIDGMGGDRAPGGVVAGMSLALKRSPNLSFVLFGDGERLKTFLSKTPRLKSVTEIVHTDQAIPAALSPAKALREYKKASMRLAIEAVNQGRCQGVLSAGNTGAYMALSKLMLKTAPGILRPAIISQIPTEKNQSVFLDLGGNLVCSTQNLVQFALMGTLFSKHILKTVNPSVGLLNVGAEETKGKREVKEAALLLKQVLPNFYGFVEGDDLLKGTVDVFVADGFSGNIALKAVEGTAAFFMRLLKSKFNTSFLRRFLSLLVRPVFRDVARKIDPRRYNGACWLGLAGIAVKSHGGADAYGFSYAIEMVAEMIKADIHQVIQIEIAEHLKKASDVRLDSA